MKRRSFLRSAAALFPAAGLEAFALGETPASPSSSQAHLVHADQDRLGESHSLGYSSILFKVLPRETANRLFVIEHLNLIKGGPALHLHLMQEEYFYVMEGEVRFQLGDTRTVLRAGDSVVGPRGVPHTFASTGQKPGRLLIAFTPAGKMEQFFRDQAVPNRAPMAPADWAAYDIQYVGPSPFTS